MKHKCFQGYREDPRSTDDLVQLALDENDLEKYNCLLQLLYYRGNEEVFCKAVELCKDTHPDKRVLGAHILAQLGRPHSLIHQEETVDLLLEMLDDESYEVIAASATSLRCREDPKSIKPLVELSSHNSPDVRYAVIEALSVLVSLDELVLQTILELANDADRDVRERAVMSIVAYEFDRPDTRQALRHCLEDEDGEIRGEALLGLNNIGEPDIVDLIIRELSRCIDENEIWDDTLDVAGDVGDVRLYPFLQKLQNDGIQSPWLDYALEKCRGIEGDKDQMGQRGC